MAKTAKTQSRKPTHDEIARVAYQIFEQSGRIPGRDLDNWLQAEAQLNGGKALEAATGASANPTLRMSPARK